MLHLADYVKIFISLIAIVNPVGALPVFIGLIGDLETQERHRIMFVVPVTVGIILLCALFFGEALLQFFAISIHSFRVGGGILLLLMAISMLHARLSPIVQTPAEARESREKDSVAVVPLSIPLLAGPGAITTVIIDAHKSPAVTHYVVIAAEIILLSCVLWLILRLAPVITRKISATGLNIFTRIMGLVLAAIAVEFISNGIKGLFPSLA